MVSEEQQSITVALRDEDVITEKAEITESPNNIEKELWRFLKIVLQLFGALQILSGLINAGLWTMWASWLPMEIEGNGNFGVFVSGYALWGGLTYTISGIFALVSARVFSTALVKCCLVMNLLSGLASLAGIIIINFTMTGSHNCQIFSQSAMCLKSEEITTKFVWGKLTLAAMEFCISTFLIALSAFKIKVPEESPTRFPIENPYEDLLCRPEPYEEIQPPQEGDEQYYP